MLYPFVDRYKWLDFRNMNLCKYLHLLSNSFGGQFGEQISSEQVKSLIGKA